MSIPLDECHEQQLFVERMVLEVDDKSNEQQLMSGSNVKLNWMY